MTADPPRMPVSATTGDGGEPMRPLHVVMTCLVITTVAGGMLLLSAARPVGRVDGAIEWNEGSMLHAIVELLCLNHLWAADYASAVKSFILGMGTGLALLAIAVATITGRPGNGADAAAPQAPTNTTPSATGGQPLTSHRSHVAPLVAAQMLALMYLLWSFASSRWSQAPDLAIGGSILLSIQLVWAVCLGRGLGVRAACASVRAVVAVMIVVALLAIAYHYGRKPGMRADFPVGNPVFLAACLIPGILLTVACLLSFSSNREVKPHVRVPLIIAIASAIAAQLWAFRIADSRGPTIGLLAGALAMWFFALRARRRWGPVLCTIVLIAAGWIYVSTRITSYSSTGRSASLRLRLYAWDYAWKMFKERPVQGHGQGGFVLAGDSYAVNDVLGDAEAFKTRIAHVHNEWLEVMADLGSIGIVLVVALILLTLHAGDSVLAARPPPEIRWTLIGSMSALVGLVVEESFGVGLRVPGVDIMYYTLIGLIWALASQHRAVRVRSGSIRRAARIGVTAALGSAGLFVMGVSQEDFASARHVRKAMDATRSGDHEQSIIWAQNAALGSRLNPQRALTNYFRLAEAHLRRADELQARARDRRMRAGQTQPPDPRLLALAASDFEQSDKDCETASAALKDLVVRSPGFMGQGRLGYWLNLIRAGNAQARGDQAQNEAFLRDAAASIRRELDRQPFSPGIAVDAVRVTLPDVDAANALLILARPLRHNRISPGYMDLSQHLANDRQFDAELREVVAKAMDSEDDAAPAEDWIPEMLRLAAMIEFTRGDHTRAQDILLQAVKRYLAMPDGPSIGAASCFAELAICQFLVDPTDGQKALASARQALSLLPESELGREMRMGVMQRMIEFNLACGKEDEAIRLLAQTAPQDAGRAEVMRELGTRYVRMCETLLGRRGGGGVLREPPAQLTRMLRAWIARALELNETQPAAHYLAADLALFTGAVEEAVGHLTSALSAGLPIEIARDFLRVAIAKQPENKTLQDAYRSLLSPSDTGTVETPNAGVNNDQ